jgi:hypothetical protein
LDICDQFVGLWRLILLDLGGPNPTVARDGEVEVLRLGILSVSPQRGVDAGQHGCKTSEYKSTDSLLTPLLNVMYCMRVSLRTVKIFLVQH